MIRKTKLLICTLVMSMVVTVLPGMTSEAAEAEGETPAAASELQDENSQRLEEVTAMDEEGNIYEIDETDGTVAEEEADGTIMFRSRSAELKVVNFNTKGNATTDYTDSNGKSGYTNGAYGADAAYLGTTSDGKIRFMLSGVTGTVNASEIQLLDYSNVAGNVSYYTVSGGYLIHYVSQNLNAAPSSSINNGPAPSYLNEGEKYYSYDGHYFYLDYGTMTYDYQDGTRSNAVNAGQEFKNYFQFLDMNQSTGYTGEELNGLVNETLLNKGKDPGSKLWDTGRLFVKYQDTYGVNALLSVSVAINESGWGMSNISQTKNNLFGLNAQDSNVGNASSYYSVESCIIDFMKNWMAGGYLNDSSWKNFGEYLGNKGGGINVKYASDPYWGEKAAAHAWTLDENGGSRDCPDAGSSDVPSEPEEPTTPVTPGEPEEPTTPVTPGEPEEPTTPETPSEPEQPTTPETPSEPEQPTTPETPSEPEQPTTPETPGEPEQPTTPETPGEPEQPTTPETPGEPEQPTTPETPGTPDEPGEGTPSDDSSAAESGSEQNPGNTTDTDSVKEVSDTGRKVTVSGNLSADAKVTVDVIAPNTDRYNSYVSANEVKGKLVLGVYDIVLTGDMDGEAQLTFHVEAKYNGKDVIILHYLEDGTYETYKGKVENGQVTISVKGFSPYVIALDDSASNTNTSTAPKTGDSANMLIWIMLLGISAAAGMTVLARRRVSG